MCHHQCNGSCKSGLGKALGFATLVAGVAAAAHFFTGERGQENRKRAAAWYEKARKESNRKLKKMRASLSEKEYDKMIEETFDKYATQAKNATKEELDELKTELKKGWQEAQDKNQNTSKRKTSRKKKS